jgi:hypothetical protein
MSTNGPRASATASAARPATTPGEVVVYSHSSFFYWWPVWVAGYIMALLTLFGGTEVPFGDRHYLFYPSKNLGVIYTFVFFLVIMLTNFAPRGVYSAVVILIAVLLVFAAALFGVMESLLTWLGELNIYMNLGFYVFFSTLIFVVWVITVFVFDHWTCWRVLPGQLIHQSRFSGASKSYDTRGMVFERVRQDLFRHWILGLGSGDLKIIIGGVRGEPMNVPNVLFVDSKVKAIQALIASQQVVAGTA